MRAPIATAVAVAIGLFILVGYFLRSIFPVFDLFLAVLLQWAIILAGVATLVGILNLLHVHFKKVQDRKKDAVYSLVTLLAFLATIIAGIFLGSGDPRFEAVVTYIQVPVETSLMALLAITLAYACLHLLSKRSINILSISFIISAFIFLFLNLGFVTSFMMKFPILGNLISGISQLPVGGTRGILIGIALGTLTTGLRILLGGDRPYSG
jgi:hypothetical protein